MITDTDITKLKKVFVTKDDLRNMEDRLKTETDRWAINFVTKNEFHNLEEKVDSIGKMTRKILGGMDAFAGTFTDLKEEYHALAMNDTRQNHQIEKIARHIGVSLKDTE